MFGYFLNGSSWWSNCCVLTPNNLTVLDRTGAWNLEVRFNHIFCQFAKDKNEPTLSYQKATRTPFNRSNSKLFQVFSRDDSDLPNDSSLTICELVKLIMDKSRAAWLWEWCLFRAGSTESTCDPLLSSSALQYPCDFVVSFLWLPGNPVIVAEQRLTSAGGLAFLWRFPWLRSDSYIEMQHTLGQHLAHTFLFVQEQHMLNLSHSLGPLATFGPLWGDATLATLFWAVIQRFGVHQDSHLWKVDKKQRERCRRNGPPQSWVDGGKLSRLDRGFLWMYTQNWGPGTLQTLVEMIDFSRKLPVLAEFRLLRVWPLQAESPKRLKENPIFHRGLGFRTACQISISIEMMTASPSFRSLQFDWDGGTVTPRT